MVIDLDKVNTNDLSNDESISSRGLFVLTRGCGDERFFIAVSTCRSVIQLRNTKTINVELINYVISACSKFGSCANNTSFHSDHDGTCS